MKRPSYRIIFSVFAAVLTLGLFTALENTVSATPSMGANCYAAGCHKLGEVPTKSSVVKTAPAKPAAPAAVKNSAPAKKPAAPVVKEIVKKGVVATVTGTSEVSVYMVNNEAVVPLRAVAEKFGARVPEWEHNKKTATVTLGTKTFTIDSSKLVNNEAYVSAKTLAEKLGASFDEGTLTIKQSKSTLATEQWQQTKHNLAYLETGEDHPAFRDTCLSCHDGAGFANNVATRAELPDPEKITSIDCATCHSDRAKEIMKTGKTPVLANGYQIANAGTGALCISCHNGRKLPTDAPKPDSNPAPHTSNQADMLFGFGGYEYGLALPNSPHSANPNTCADCHVAEKDGILNHEFSVQDAEKACSSCHAGITTVNRTALGDYDGDKVIEGTQDEVKGLIALLEQALAEAVPNGHLHESHGQLYFEDAVTLTPIPVDNPQAYFAAWNLLAVEFDSSYGIHNPAYTISLLQNSYKQLTGKDVPNATLR